MKKVIVLIILLIPFTIKAEEIVSIEEKYFKTIEMIPENESIESHSMIISTTEEITKEEYDLGVEEPSRENIIIETTYKKMTVTIAKAQSLYKYTLKLHWKNMPSTRSYDIMGIAYYGSVEPKVDPIFEQEYCRSNGNCYTIYTHYPRQELASVSAVFLLPTGTLTSLDQTLTVLVGKVNSNATIISQKAVGDYAHAINNVSLNNAQNYTMGLSGLNLDTIIYFDYDEISYAQATWSGTW